MKMIRILFLTLAVTIASGMCVNTVRAEDADSTCTHEQTSVTGKKKATPSDAGYTGDTTCDNCGKVLESGSKIARIKTVKLSKTSYVYNGKERKPGVTVTDTDGKTISSSNYSVTYKKNKNVGTASVVVKFSGSSYSGSITKEFKIKPKAVSIKTLTGVSKGFTATWKNLTAQASGYQIQAATNSKFTKGKVTTTIEGKSKTSASVTSVKANKKYYVRIRSYKTVSGEKYYSAWSSAKTVKTKKRVTVIAGDSIAGGLRKVEYNGIKDVKVSGTKLVRSFTGANVKTYRTSKKFGSMTGLQRVISDKPYRLYFMLGINEVEWMKVSTIVDNYKTLIKEVQKKSPATDIVVLSVSPVTKSVSGRGWFKNIRKLNKQLKAMAKECGVAYYDYTSVLKNSSGYLASKYAAGDGIHWTRSAYTKFGDAITAYDKKREKQK